MTQGRCSLRLMTWVYLQHHYIGVRVIKQEALYLIRLLLLSRSGAFILTRPSLGKAYLVACILVALASNVVNRRVADSASFCFAPLIIFSIYTTTVRRGSAKFNTTSRKLSAHPWDLVRQTHYMRLFQSYRRPNSMIASIYFLEVLPVTFKR